MACVHNGHLVIIDIRFMIIETSYMYACMHVAMSNVDLSTYSTLYYTGVGLQVNNTIAIYNNILKLATCIQHVCRESLVTFGTQWVASFIDTS